MRPRRHDDALEKRATEPAAPVLRQDDVAHVRPARQVRADRGGAACDRPVDPADHANVVGLAHAAPLELVRGDRVPRHHGAPEGRVRLVTRAVVEGELGDLEVRVDAHPDRFSLPCRLAYTSPRLKIARPSGMRDGADHERAARCRARATPSDAPSRIAARIPSSAYVAGEIFDEPLHPLRAAPRPGSRRPRRRAACPARRTRAARPSPGR